MFRIGDRVCHIYHMSNEGIVVEMYQQQVTAENTAGVFSKRWIVKFKSDLDGKIHEMKAQDLMKVG